MIGWQKDHYNGGYQLSKKILPLLGDWNITSLKSENCRNNKQEFQLEKEGNELFYLQWNHENKNYWSKKWSNTKLLIKKNHRNNNTEWSWPQYMKLLAYLLNKVKWINISSNQLSNIQTMDKQQNQEKILVLSPPIERNINC